jgi:hypothetical protein
MFQTPMSSPMMNTMFGFLPFWSLAFTLVLAAMSCALVTVLQQLSAPLGQLSGLIASFSGVALDRWNGLKLGLAAA